jgi:glycosyltransferase involved in cell wall biosynthesis
MRSSACRIVRYHNITPAHFFEGFDDDVAKELRAARNGLFDVARAADYVWADSDYNARELRSGGIADIRVVPLFFAIDQFHIPPDPAFLARFTGTLRNILFVGRMAPNKGVEELILAFAWLNKQIDPATRLILAGSERSCPRYYAMLQMLAAQLGLTNVCFAGFLSEPQLAAAYQAADVFACVSHHEGYCLPLLEAMSYGVPVVARETGGMPEALGHGGVMYNGLEPHELAELLHRILVDASLRREVLGSQDTRLAAIRGRDLKAELQELLGQSTT